MASNQSRNVTILMEDVLSNLESVVEHVIDP